MRRPFFSEIKKLIQGSIKVPPPKKKSAQLFLAPNDQKKPFFFFFTDDNDSITIPLDGWRKKKKEKLNSFSPLKQNYYYFLNRTFRL